MDELEKNEEQEMIPVSEDKITEELAEEAVAEEESAEELPVEEMNKHVEKSSSNIFAIIAGFVVFFGILAYCWMMPGSNTVADTGVMYAKDNDLYLYDLKNEPYLLQEDIADGGSYHYFYTAWGANVTEDGWAYYSANVDETGAFDLYRKNAKDPAAEAQLIDSNVYDYMPSKEGGVVAYLAMHEDSLRLCVYAGGNSRTYATGMRLEDDGYKLSADGRYLVYKDRYDMLCATEVKADRAENVLTDDCPLYALAEDTLYFVSKTATEAYNIYSYDFKNEPKLVAENAQYMELMPNGRDLLYGVLPSETIPYTELIVDDMAEIDAAMKEGDEGYAEKQMRDDIRAAMKNGEGIQPMLQEYYVLTNGKAKLVAEDVVSAVAVTGSEKSFVTGYKAKEFQPVHMSVIGGGLEMVEMVYYMSLNYGGMQPFLADAAGNLEVLTGGEVQLDTIKVSNDGKKAAYLLTDPNTGGNILMQMEIGKGADAEAVQMDVKDFAFLGGNGPLCYYYDYANGAGTIASVESERTITNATGVQFAADVKDVYYIQNISGTTGVGQMQHWDGKGEPVIVDGDVFAFQYKGNGKAAIIYNYDVLKQTGDLGYYDGKGVTMLDEDMTALFIY